MRIVYIGCVRFSEHCLKNVLLNGAEIVGVVSKKNDGMNADYADLSRIAADAGIPILHCVNVNDVATLEWIGQLMPDIIFCFGWSQLLKQELLSLPSMGILGAHPTLLPKNRGCHPLIWTLILGLKETGLTFYFMNKNVDAGPILAQQKISIEKDDTAFSLYQRIESTATILIKAFMPRLINKNYSLVNQNPDYANYWRKRHQADGKIDWRMSAVSICNLIRALTRPYPGAEFIYKDTAITIWSAEVINTVISNVEPGKVISVTEGVPTIKCQEDALRLLEWEPKIAPSVGEYL